VVGKGSQTYPRSELLRLWKLLLLNQFHDVLPGSSINEVYVDAMQHFKDIQTSGERLWNNALLDLVKSSVENSAMVVNTLCWDRQEVIDVSAISKDLQMPAGHCVQTSEDGISLAYASCPAMGYCSSSTSLFTGPPAMSASVVKSQTEGTFVLSNGILRASIDGNGCVTSCVLLTNGRSLLCKLNTVHRTNDGFFVFLFFFYRDAIASEQCGNQFVLFDDIPLFWDAWDVMEYHLETRKPVAGGVVTVKDVGPLRASVQVKMAVGQRSSLVQTIYLDVGCSALTFNTEVDWHENHKFLKVEFPLNIRSSVATYEIQFGHLDRPTHYNTSWDQAQFEVCGHKWADLSEHGFGVALLNDCKYGYSTLANVMRLSLLRSPKAPDETSDMGRHTFKYALLPHKGEFQTAGVIKQAYELNYPLRLCGSCGDGDLRKSFFQVSDPGIIIECVKPAEDRKDCLLVRLYESFGGWREAHLSTSMSVSDAHRCNILEERQEMVEVKENRLYLQFNPFEIVSLLLQVT
jgi:alpha-mannosidase